MRWRRSASAISRCLRRRAASGVRYRVRGRTDHPAISPSVALRRSALHAAPYRWIAWLCWCAFAATNGVYAADQHPIPEATRLIVDEAGALTEAEREEIAGRLKTIQDSGRAQ